MSAGSDEGDKQPNVPPSSDPIAKALADLTQQMASLFVRLEALEFRSLVITTFHHSAARFPLRLVGLWDNSCLHARFRCRSIPTSIACVMSTALL